MATLYVTEYAALQIMNGVPVPAEHPVVEQAVSFSGTAGQSSAFNAKTRFVRIQADGICSVLFGTNPTATTASRRMASGQTEFVGVPPGQSYRASAITNT